MSLLPPVLQKGMVECADQLCTNALLDNRYMGHLGCQEYQKFATVECSRDVAPCVVCISCCCSQRA